MVPNTAVEQLQALRGREVSSRELVERAIGRIESQGHVINAVVVRDFERAREAAGAADEHRAAGVDRPLLGLPLTVKEAFDVAGLPTTWGLPGAHPPAASDAVLVERLKAAGAIILGKTNVATVLADWQTNNPVYGVTSNPWNRTRTPGGSSGGGAAAVAVGIVPLDFGSDLAGSLRIPAAFCGVLAHRPSFGLISMRGFAPPMAPRTRITQQLDQATVGPIARSADDLMLALDIVVGPDIPNDTAHRVELPRPRRTQLDEFRVLVLAEHPLCATEAAVSGALARLAGDLEKQGCRVGRDAQAVPDLKDLAQTFHALLMSAMSADAPDGAEGNAMTHAEWLRLDRHRLQLAEQWLETFATWDVVLTPVAPTTAFPHDHRPFEERRLKVDSEEVPYATLPLWTSIAAPAGLPATAFPLGLDPQGLPIGIQIIGPRCEDRTTIGFAQLLEAAFGRFREYP